MKTIWLVLSMIALANILALAGFVGWLAATERLNRERVEKLRELFAKPVGIEAAELEAMTVAQAMTRQQELAAEKLAQPPIPAADRLNQDRAEAELATQRMLRRQREIDDLGSQLLRRQDELDQREEELNLRIAAFESQKKKYLEIEGTAQFQTALATLEGLKAREAKSMLEVMMSEGLADEVIAYLAKMDERKRSAIVSEFAKERPTVAADLLERLRTRGVVTAEDAGESPRAGNSTADAVASSPGS
jgi:hypothetical protein